MSKRFKVLTQTELEKLITIEMKAYQLEQDIRERLLDIGLDGKQVDEIICDDFEWMSCISMNAQEDEKQIIYELKNDGSVERVEEVIG